MSLRVNKSTGQRVNGSTSQRVFWVRESDGSDLSDESDGVTVRGDLLWGEGLGEDFDEAREGVAVEVGLRNPNEVGWKCGFGGGFE